MFRNKFNKAPVYGIYLVFSQFWYKKLEFSSHSFTIFLVVLVQDSLGEFFNADEDVVRDALRKGGTDLRQYTSENFSTFR